MTQMTTSRAAEVAGYLKPWMFDPNHAHHPLRAKPSMPWNPGGAPRPFAQQAGSSSSNSADTISSSPAGDRTP